MKWDGLLKYPLKRLGVEYREGFVDVGHCLLRVLLQLHPLAILR